MIADPAGGSASAATGYTTSQTFAALDAEAGPGTPAWIHAGAQRAEAGFQDPALGWVGVRADMGGAGVNATLVPGSADASLALGGHLAGLNDYLAEQHTPVSTLTLAAHENPATASSMDQGAKQDTGHGTNEGAGQNAGQGAYSRPEGIAGVHLQATPEAAAIARDVSGAGNRQEMSAQVAGSGGGHISVMA